MKYLTPTTVGPMRSRHQAIDVLRFVTIWKQKNSRVLLERMKEKHMELLAK